MSHLSTQPIDQMGMDIEATTVFGGFHTHRIRDPQRSAYLEQICDMWSGLSPQKSRRFPGPNPCSIEKADFDTIRQHQYKVCEKTDGYRVLLVACMFGEYQLLTLITRAWDVYVIPLEKCPRVWYQGTVLDGELVKNKAGQWIWMGFDAIVVSGIPVYRDSLDDRLEALKRSIQHYEPSPKDTVILRIKPYYNTLQEYEDHVADVQHNVDGVILTPATLGIHVGRHQNMYKLKGAGQHTVDFLYKDRGLHVFDPKQQNHVCVANMTIDIPPGSIIECSFENNTWRFHHVRHDKTTANDMLTYKKTLTNIDENIQLRDIAGLLV